MAASENEGIYFVSNILIESHEIFNGSDVSCDVFGVKESENHVQMTIILVAEGYS